MQHTRDVKFTAGEAERESVAADRSEILSGPEMRDRSSPAWLLPLSFFFILAAEACVSVVALLPVFFQSMVAGSGETLLAPLLILVAAVPLLGLLVFEYGYSKAFAGFRAAREKSAVHVRALLGLMIALALAALHPLLAAPFAVGAVLALFVAWAANKFLRDEPAWDFLPPEAVSVLSGRDLFGWRLANARPDKPALAETGLRVSALMALTCGFACASWLAAVGIWNIASIASTGLLSFWATRAFGDFFHHKLGSRFNAEGLAHAVTELPLAEETDDSTRHEGLVVSHLSAFDKQGKALLSDINLNFEPGTIVGIAGENFSGKSLLMQAINGPYDLNGLVVSGSIRAGGQNPWQREAQDRFVASVLVQPQPLLVPGNGADNLSCFGAEYEQTRAERALKQLVLTTDTVNRIRNCADARRLSTSEQKALGLARSFFLRPRVYLFDRPEDGASTRMLAALAEKIEKECRLGAIFLIATENRELLDLCDQIVVMDGGRIADIGPAQEIRAQRAIGWHRLKVERAIDSEETLGRWLSSQFRRDGDGANIRNVCMVGRELLSFSCHDLPPDSQHAEVQFEFKNFEGHCILRMRDAGQPVSSGFFDKMQTIAQESEGLVKIPPLAAAMQGATKVETRSEADMRVIEAKIATYDPRKTTLPEVTP